MMERIQKTDTAYQDNSEGGSPASPQFSRSAAHRAQQVVALRPAFQIPFQRLWTSLGTGTHRARLLVGIVLFAIAGGVAGGLLAIASNNSERMINAEVMAVADASSHTDNPEPISPSKVEPASERANLRPPQEFKGPEVERAVAELRRRRPATKAKKAYRVAIIYPDDDEDFDYKRKGGRKH